MTPNPPLMAWVYDSEQLLGIPSRVDLKLIGFQGKTRESRNLLRSLARGQITDDPIPYFGA